MFRLRDFIYFLMLFGDHKLYDFLRNKFIHKGLGLNVINKFDFYIACYLIIKQVIPENEIFKISQK